jgi:imidazoleglycerol-phosphate dehydratase
MTKSRTASILRETKETNISVTLDLDGSGKSKLDIGIPFLEHMLNQVARHGVVDLNISAKGDLDIDAHHTVEDVGISLGQALSKALGDKQGIVRYGHAYVPLDEALSRVVLDCSGRPGLVYDAEYPRSRVGDFDIDLLHEFFQGFVNHGLVTLHIDCLRGRNSHHIAETIFKAFGRALRMAVSFDERIKGITPSTKGSL